MSCDTCKQACSDCLCTCSAACGSPAGLGALANRAQKNMLDVRIGDYPRFRCHALDRLSAQDAGPLHALRTRDDNDPCIALLDAWAMAADVLTFYRERYTNEGYLRTAGRESSLRELAATVGYKPRPGVAAAVHLAYLLEPGAAPVEIPAGARTQSVPLPGEQMQTFETGEALDAHAEWSMMAPRRTRMPRIGRAEAMTRDTLKLADTSLFIRPGERLLFVFGHGPGQQVVREVASAKNDVENGWVALTLKPRPGLNADIAGELFRIIDLLAKRKPVVPGKGRGRVRLLEALVSYVLGGSPADLASAMGDIDERVLRRVTILDGIVNSRPPEEKAKKKKTIDDLLDLLDKAAPAQLSSTRFLQRAVVSGLASDGAQRGDMLKTLFPQIGELLYAAWSRLPVNASDGAPTVYLLRTVASPYGAAAPRPLERNAENPDHKLMPADGQFAFLDTVNEAIAADSYVVLETPALQDKQKLANHPVLRFAWVRSTKVVGRGDYDISGKVTRLELADPASGAPLWVVPKADDGGLQYRFLDFLRNCVYVVQSERVALSPEPIDDEVHGDTITLDALYGDLKTGRWVIIAGERIDIPANGMPIPGIYDAELAMIAGVRQEPDPHSPGDACHTVIVLQTSLAYRYRRASVTVYGNVVKATHGETVSEVLGSGNAQLRLARFELKRAPLTWTAAPTTSGIAGSETVRVNALRWQEVDSLLDANAADHAYEIALDDKGAATLCFGDGVHGARLPSGQENIRATYRVGIGRAGNVRAEQISLLATRPLGVRGVINPLKASGGANPDGKEQIRSNVPLAARALSPRSRLVSVSDYAVFARRFAGIGHAVAAMLPGEDRAWVHVTLAGVDDAPLDPSGVLLKSLLAAYLRYGDPALPVVLGIRELIALVIQARVAIADDASWDVVEPKLRERLLDAFSFARREPGRSAWLSEAVAVMQATPGVAWVDVDVFGGIPEFALRSTTALAAAVAVLSAQAAGEATATVVHCAAAMAAANASHADRRRLERAARRDGEAAVFLPAQIVYLVPAVPETLILNYAPKGAARC